MQYFLPVSILFAVFNSAFAKNVKKDEEMMTSCSPIYAHEHDPLRCRELGESGKEYDFDDDCCAGSESSGAPGLCANSFNRTETKDECGQDHEWCQKYGCKHYTCEKSISCVEYVGCYNDKEGARDLPFKASRMDYKHVESSPSHWLLGKISACANYCRSKNFSFAALQGPGACFCGDSYGKHGRADERLCDKKNKKAAALRCGNGDAETCVGVNAVYRLTGNERCCDYNEPATATTECKAWVLWLIVGNVCFGICMIAAICGYRAGIYLYLRRDEKKKEQQRLANTPKVHDAGVVVVQPRTVQPVLVTVVDPTTQKTDMSQPVPMAVVPATFPEANYK